MPGDSRRAPASACRWELERARCGNGSMGSVLPRVELRAVVVVVVLIAVGCGERERPGTGTSLGTRASAPPRCAVTMPNGSTPPGEARSAAHHGNGALWTVLPRNGRVVGVDEEALADRAALARIVGDGIFGLSGADGSIRAKFPWWWGGQGVKPQLSITGRRLDQPAGPLRVEGRPGSGEPDFWASGMIFPTDGCWKVTGRAGDTALSFVVQVIDSSGASPTTSVLCAAGVEGAARIDRRRDAVIGPLVLMGARLTVRHRPDAFNDHGFKVPVSLPNGMTATLLAARTAHRRVGLVFTQEAQDRAWRKGVRGADGPVMFGACPGRHRPSRTAWPGGLVVDRPRCVTLVVRLAASGPCASGCRSADAARRS
jgi:hypothetical protein